MHSSAYDPVAEARRVLEGPTAPVGGLARRLAEAVVELHDIVRDISTAVGGATSSNVSAAFLRLVPCEVRARVAALREEVDTARLIAEDRANHRDRLRGEIDSAMAVAVAHAPGLGGTPRQVIEHLIERRKEADRHLAAEQRAAIKLREAIGLMTTIKPDMVMRVDDPVGMAREVAAWVDMIRGDRDAAQERVRVAEGMLADVRCELDAAGVPANPDIGSRVRYLAMMRVDRQPPPAIAGDQKPLFTAMVPGPWSTSADEWFTYRRIGTTPWVTVWWRHGPGVANSTVGAGPTCAASREVQRDDVAAILRALGLGDHARTASCHEIVQGEVLPAINRLPGRPGSTRARCSP